MIFIKFSIEPLELALIEVTVPTGAGDRELRGQDIL